eukprot:TRINITY_DN480_c0_g1_i1.p1 TRINITY_DN480_c0_g1~~TRINITY_DN480_c0_g1_i1.p1  ORF type:complete len:648 (-),score=161.28 TRINITY_DN480_c0_g1_i1:125-2038(-)
MAEEKEVLLADQLVVGKKRALDEEGSDVSSYQYFSSQRNAKEAVLITSDKAIGEYTPHHEEDSFLQVQQSPPELSKQNSAAATTISSPVAGGGRRHAANGVAGSRRSSVTRISDGSLTGAKLNYKDAKIRPLMTVAFMTFFSSYFVMSITTGFIPQIAQQEPYNLSESVIGLIFALFQLAQAVISPLAGYLCNKYSRFPVLMLGVVFQTIGTMVFAVSSSALGFGISRSIQGVGAGFMSVAGLALLVSNVENLEDALGFQEVITAGGFIVSVSLGSAIYSSFGFVWVFVLTSVLNFIVLGYGAFSWMCSKEHWIIYDRAEPLDKPQGSVTETEEEGDAGRVSASARLSLASPPTKVFYNYVLLICMVAAFQAFFSIAAVDPILGPHMQSSVGVSTAVIGLLFAASDIFNVIGSMLGSTISEMISNKSTAVLGLFLTGVSFCLLGPVPYLDQLFTTPALSWFALSSGGILYGFGLALAIIPLVPMMKDSVDDKLREFFRKTRNQTVSNKQDENAYVNSMDDQASNFVSAVFNTTSAIGQVVGPIAAGALVEFLPKRREITCHEEIEGVNCVNGYQWTSFLFAVGCFIIAAFVQILVPKDEKSEEEIHDQKVRDVTEETTALISAENETDETEELGTDI